jgi:hypothetical protein
MSNVLEFAPRGKARAVSLPETDTTLSAIPPSREVIDWCLMILQQTDETSLRIPLARSYSPNTIYEVICDFAGRGWTATTDGPLALKFCLKGSVQR